MAITKPLFTICDSAYSSLITVNIVAVNCNGGHRSSTNVVCVGCYHALHGKFCSGR